MTETSATPEPDHPTQLTDDALEVALAAARAAEDKHGRDIVVLDVGDILSIVAYFVVLEAPNRRLVRTLVDEIEEAVDEVQSDGIYDWAPSDGRIQPDDYDEPDEGLELGGGPASASLSEIQQVSP